MTNALPPELITRARDVRDARALELQRATQAWRQALDTLSQLDAFHQQLLGRSPARVSGPQSAGACADWQAFVTGLDRARAQQAAAAEGLQARHAQAQQHLSYAQTRLTALEALEARRLSAREKALARAQQRECDAFAARASQARAAAMAMQGATLAGGVR